MSGQQANASQQKQFQELQGRLPKRDLPEVYLQKEHHKNQLVLRFQPLKKLLFFPDESVELALKEQHLVRTKKYLELHLTWKNQPPKAAEVLIAIERLKGKRSSHRIDLSRLP